MNYQETIDYLSNFSKAKKIEYINKQIKQVNAQMLKIEQADIYSQGYERALSDIGGGRKRFRNLRKNASDYNINRTLSNIVSFKNSDSYYIKDIRKNMKDIRKNLAEYDIFTFKSQKDFNNFYKILHSNEFGRAQRLGILDSGTEMDEVKEALLNGASVEEITSALHTFARSEISVDEFQNLVDKNKKRMIKSV